MTINSEKFKQGTSGLPSSRYLGPSLRLELQQLPPVDDTDNFRRGLDRFRKIEFNLRPFPDLTPGEQSRVMQLAQMCKLGLAICEWDDDGFDCQSLGTVTTGERVLCARHHVMAVRG